MFSRCFLCGLTARWRLVAMVSNQASLATLLSWMLDVPIKQTLRHMLEAATQMDIATKRVHARRAALQQDSRLKWNTEQFLKYLSTGSNILHLSLIFFHYTMRGILYCSKNCKDRNLLKTRRYFSSNTNYWLNLLMLYFNSSHIKYVVLRAKLINPYRNNVENRVSS